MQNGRRQQWHDALETPAPRPPPLVLSLQGGRDGRAANERTPHLSYGMNRPRQRSQNHRPELSTLALPGKLCEPENMDIVLMGAAGFIGSHLCDYLLGGGHKVIAVDNLATGNTENLAHLFGRPGLRFIQHDITHPFDLQGRLDWVLNFASAASPCDYIQQGVETLQTGSLGTQHALDLALRTGARFLLASTSECYGDPLVHPQPENYWGNVNPIGPRSVYDEAKRYAEALTMAYHRYRKADTRIIRIFNTYGPRMKLNDGRVVPSLIAQALCDRPLTVFGDGSQTRSFCYISDLVEGIARVMECSIDHLPMNLGNPQEISILEFARKIQELTRSRSPIEFEPLPEDDPKQRCPDISRARQLLGWEPRVNLEDGLRLTIDYFRNKVQAPATERQP